MNADVSLVEVLGWPLLNFLWQGALIGCGASLLCAIMRNARPQSRYLILCSALLACICWPVYGVYQELHAPRAVQLETALAFMQQSAGRFDIVFVHGHQFLAGMQAYLPIIVFIWLGGHLLARIKRLVRDDQQEWHWTMATPIVGVLFMGIVASAVAQHDQDVDDAQHQALNRVIQQDKSSGTVPDRAPVPLLVNLNSAHAVVIDDASGKVLLQKEANRSTPMASLSKLMTAIVILDAGLDMQENLSVKLEDVTALKGAMSHLPVGAYLTRHQMLEMMLIPSDNRAAQVLARTFPGGEQVFLMAAQRKIEALALTHMHMEEPAGYSKQNVASAADLARLTQEATHYPELVHIASAASTFSNDPHHRVAARDNTNVLVGQKEWDIHVSKTGFTREAGRCILMHLQVAGRAITMVLMGADSLEGRAADIVNIRQAIERNS